MRPFSELFGASEFAIGLLVGTIALLLTLPVVLGLTALSSQRRPRPGVVGAVFAVAVLAALAGTLGTDEIYPVPAAVLLGVALLWAAGTIASWTRAAWLVGPLAALPGALLLAGENEGLTAGWVGPLVVVGTVVIGATAADFDRRTARYGLGPLLLAVTVVGIYVSVPDTELVRAVVGVMLPLVLLAWPYAAARLGAGGSYAAVGVLLWIVPIDGIGRAGSVVGAVGAFALLYGEPLGRCLVLELERRVRLTRFPLRRPRALVVLAQVGLVAYATRVAGRVDTAQAALVLLVPGIAACVAFGVFCVVPERRRRRHRPQKRRPRSSAGSIPPPPRSGPSGRDPDGRGDPRNN